MLPGTLRPVTQPRSAWCLSCGWAGAAGCGEQGCGASSPSAGTHGRHDPALPVLSWSRGLRECSLEAAAAAAAEPRQPCPTLGDPTDGSPPGSPAPGILQARALEWVPSPSPMHESEVTESCPTLSDPMDCSPPGSPVPGILQARALEWVAISFSNA